MLQLYLSDQPTKVRLILETWRYVFLSQWRHFSPPLRLRHNEPDGVSNHQPYDCLLKRLFRRKSKETWKLRVTGLCEGNSPVTGEFPAQMARNAENVSIWWRHHAIGICHCVTNVGCVVNGRHNTVRIMISPYRLRCVCIGGWRVHIKGATE